MSAYKDALDAVTAIDIFKNTTDHNPKTLGEYSWPHQTTIRRALRIADALMREPSKEMLLSAIYSNQRYLSEIVDNFKSMRHILLKEVDDETPKAG